MLFSHGHKTSQNFSLSLRDPRPPLSFTENFVDEARVFVGWVRFPSGKDALSLSPLSMQVREERDTGRVPKGDGDGLHSVQSCAGHSRALYFLK